MEKKQENILKIIHQHMQEAYHLTEDDITNMIVEGGFYVPTVTANEPESPGDPFWDFALSSKKNRDDYYVFQLDTEGNFLFSSHNDVDYEFPNEEDESIPLTAEQEKAIQEAKMCDEKYGDIWWPVDEMYRMEQLFIEVGLVEFPSYGLPTDDEITQEEAIKIAITALKNTLLSEEIDVDSLKSLPYFFVNPERMWNINFVSKMGMESVLYSVSINSDTGEVMDVADSKNSCG